MCMFVCMRKEREEEEGKTDARAQGELRREK